MNNSQQTRQFTNASGSFSPEDKIDFQKVFGQIYQSKWVILASAIGALFISSIYTFLHTTPTYQSTGLMQVNAQTTNDSMLSSLGYKTNVGSSSIDTQSALMKTRYILQPVVLQNHLNITATPRYFPVFGKWMARNYQGKGLAKPFLRLKSYAWGGEEAQIRRFVVPKTMVGHSFQLIVGEENTYQIYSAPGELALSGKTGEMAARDGIELELVLKARPGTEFVISYQSPIGVSTQLANRLQISNVLGINSSQSTGIVQLQLTGSDPDSVVSVLNSIMSYSVEKSVSKKTHETQKTLFFLNRRVPQLESAVAQAEDAVNQYHSRHGILNMGAVQYYLMAQLTTLERTLERLKIEKQTLLQIYTPLHPVVIAAATKEAELQQKLAVVHEKIKKFPFENQEEVNLKRNIRLKYVTYVSLLNRSQQLEIAKAGFIPDIIALTDATPAAMLPTHKVFKSLVGFFIGALFSIMLVLIKSILTKTVESAEQLEEELQLPVQAVIPHSRKQKQMEKARQKSLNTFGTALTAPLILAKQSVDDISIESLRSLRMSLQMMAAGSSHRIIATLGSLSNIGKSFVSLNLAQVIADTGKRTLLIDADVRKGRLHHALLQSKSNGLSEYLEGKCSYENLVRSIDHGFFYIPCGSCTQHPIGLFESQRFQDLIAKVRQEI